LPEHILSRHISSKMVYVLRGTSLMSRSLIKRQDSLSATFEIA
jgi:hypothetical protein